jgi:hypothetical protein
VTVMCHMPYGMFEEGIASSQEGTGLHSICLLGLGVWGLLEVVLWPHWFVTTVYVDRSSPPWSVGIGYVFWSVEFTLGRFWCESWVLLEDWSGASRYGIWRCTDFGSIVGF